MSRSASISIMVYALDSTTIDLCLVVFPWARFRAKQAAIKLRNLLDLRGPIPSPLSAGNWKSPATHSDPRLVKVRWRGIAALRESWRGGALKGPPLGRSTPETLQEAAEDWRSTR